MNDIHISPGSQAGTELAAQIAALAHPARIEILRYLADAEGCCCKDVVCRLDLAQSTVSQHLKVLVDAGLVRIRPDRQRSCYSLDRAALRRFGEGFNKMLDGCCAGSRCRTDTDHG